jgi:hypothetical protein
VKVAVGVAFAIVSLVAAGCGTTRIVDQTKVEATTVTVTRTTPTQPTVYTETYDGTLAYMPDSMSYGGGAQSVEKIHWSTYGGPEAVGEGVWAYDTCTSKNGCAGGPYKYSPVSVRLDDRTLCKGVPAYQDWALSGPKIHHSMQPILSDAFSAACGG